MSGKAIDKRILCLKETRSRHSQLSDFIGQLDKPFIFNDFSREFTFDLWTS